ncbi:hypothetical protein BN961_03091 [Afipia felis]|uniref:Uncharacterized protein n=1 Tax=Afipia felis TaxID=1035 RepID=A0A090MQL6_AFIFE|nr:hypothetical protein BN961_03091 [Afipia felis]
MTERGAIAFDLAHELRETLDDGLRRRTGARRRALRLTLRDQAHGGVEQAGALHLDAHGVGADADIHAVAWHLGQTDLDRHRRQRRRT